VIGLLRRGHHPQERFGDLRMSAGDVLLAFGSDESKESLRHSPDFHLIEGVSEKIYRRDKAPLAFAIVLGLVTLFVLGVHPCTAALGGALALVLTGCLSVAQGEPRGEQADPDAIAGTLALSKALQKTGATDAAGSWRSRCTARAATRCSPASTSARS
jgi:hypothetical protein